MAIAAKRPESTIPMPEHPVTLTMTPLGHLLLAQREDAPPVPEAIASRLSEAFRQGSGHGLLALGACAVGMALPPVLGWWRDFAARFVAGVCTLPEDADQAVAVPAPDLGELQTLAWTAPPMDGAEYLNAEVLQQLWDGLAAALQQELAAARQPLQDFLHQRHQAWNLVGRVHVHLAENRTDAATPFAFLATYTTRLSAQGTAKHQPLGQALREFAGAADKKRLFGLLQPLQRAAEQCPWLKTLIDERSIYHPLRWTAAEALRFLQDAPQLEQAGLVVRMPASWRGSRPARPRVSATVGSAPPSAVGLDTLLDFSVSVTLDGEPLTPAEMTQLLKASQGLVLIRGRWVEIDSKRLQQTIAHFREVEKLAESEGLGFHQAMRLLSGAGTSEAAAQARAEADWSQVVAGPWMAETLARLRGPDGLAVVSPGAELRTTLRPYQEVGVRWLHLLTRLRLGACLADDMGLGKTIQIIALLVVLKRQDGRMPSLLVAPASLLANWAQEIARFAPSLSVLIAHPSSIPAERLAATTADQLASTDLVVTSYGSLHRLPWMISTAWRLAILDEAQAIKNPGTRQSRAAKQLKAQARIVLTGTPIENRLGDLWSLFDYINPGLLGGAKPFTAWTRALAGSPQGYAPLRRLVQPYVLRRLKTDKTVIADLPGKTEMTAFCSLSKRQAALYQQSVQQLAKAIATTSGIERRGLVLGYLMRFKQICNHPSHWLGDGAWDEADSGKLGRLRELAEVIAAKQDKVLVFTQFREMASPLAAFLGGIFGHSGLVLTGETPVKIRKDLVSRFQEDERIPFFVLSLKAGGSGLNLTAASHVIHFDRWWNPAVENQATDRAFRIGQTRNVLVHKFTCRGTVEERIEEMIAGKRQLSDQLIDGDQSGEIALTELGDEELLHLVSLDLNHASAQD